jgi:hypothetical protein
MNGPVDKGATDVTTNFNLGTAGLTIANITASYSRLPASAGASSALTALATTTTAHTDNRGIEVSASLAPGVYRVDFPDAAFATGADRVLLSVTATTGQQAQEVIPLMEPLRLKGSVTTATGLSTTAFRDSARSATADFYNDMIVCWTTGTLKGLAFRITDYGGSAGSYEFTTSTMPSAAANGDEYVIIGRATA